MLTPPPVWDSVYCSPCSPADGLSSLCSGAEWQWLHSLLREHAAWLTEPTERGVWPLTLSGHARGQSRAQPCWSRSIVSLCRWAWRSTALLSSTWSRWVLWFSIMSYWSGTRLHMWKHVDKHIMQRCTKFTAHRIGSDTQCNWRMLSFGPRSTHAHHQQFHTVQSRQVCSRCCAVIGPLRGNIGGRVYKRAEAAGGDITWETIPTAGHTVVVLCCVQHVNDHTSHPARLTRSALAERFGSSHAAHHSSCMYGVCM